MIYNYSCWGMFSMMSKISLILHDAKAKPRQGVVPCKDTSALYLKIVMPAFSYIHDNSSDNYVPITMY